MNVVSQVDLLEYPLLARGKVRDVFSVDEGSILIVTTDRMSAFDVIMNEPVPYKGVVLNQLSIFWMKRFKSLVRNHLFASSFDQFPEDLQQYAGQLAGRSVLARRAQPLLMECVVRGHMAGSSWEEYQKSGTVCGQRLPVGLKESSKFPEPLFTPATKAEQGSHDENISHEAGINLLGKELFHQVKDISLQLFSAARDYAEERGIIIADTKFEFGIYEGELMLIDEALTPDSSRFWPVQGYRPGQSQPSFDKQYLRDWLAAQPWDKNAPAPALPQKIVDETAKKYQEAYSILTGETLKFD